MVMFSLDVPITPGLSCDSDKRVEEMEHGAVEDEEPRDDRGGGDEP